VLGRIGDVAYKLALPLGVRIHDAFHVGLLKPFYGAPPALPSVQHGRVLIQPEKVLKGCVARGKRGIFVWWKGAPAAESSWVELDDFVQQYPELQLENELFVQGGRDVMYDRTFDRCKKTQGAQE
jgi:hypothetical protein